MKWKSKVPADGDVRWSRRFALVPRRITGTDYVVWLRPLWYREMWQWRRPSGGSYFREWRVVAVYEKKSDERECDRGKSWIEPQYKNSPQKK